MPRELLSQAAYGRRRGVSQQAVWKRTITAGGPIPVHGPEETDRRRRGGPALGRHHGAERRRQRARRDGARRGPTARRDGLDKGLVLNKTNGKALLKAAT